MQFVQAEISVKTVNFRDSSDFVLQSTAGVKKNWFNMTEPGFRKQVDRHARHLLDGDFDQLKSYCDTILPVFHGDDLIIISGHHELHQFFEIFRDHLLATGVAQIQGEIIGAKTGPTGRFQNTVKWHYVDLEGNPAGSAQVLYYGSQRDGKSIIEVVHYQDFDERRADVWGEFQSDQPGFKIVPKNQIIH